LTLGENIADFGGIAIAFDALDDALRGRDDPLLDSYSQRRRFFLSWATLWRQNLTRDERALRRRIDVHAPAAVRANAAAAHCSAFTAAFDCNPGDAMAIAAGERIDIW
jgi:putative endopeptidase